MLVFNILALPLSHDRQGTYDSINRIMYAYVAELGKMRGNTLIGMSVDTGNT